MSSTGHKHVYKSSFPYGKPYLVVMKVQNRTYNVGYFATIAESSAAAKGFKKALKFFGKETEDETKAHRNSKSNPTSA